MTCWMMTRRRSLVEHDELIVMGGGGWKRIVGLAEELLVGRRGIDLEN